MTNRRSVPVLKGGHGDRVRPGDQSDLGDLGDAGGRRDWMPFPGGELEGVRPRTLCGGCRAALRQRALAERGAAEAPAVRPPICFQCYRAELERLRALRAAGELDTASEERFQTSLPFEPVNRPRLEMLRAERLASRASRPAPVAQFEDRRHRAQMAARRALQSVVAGLRATGRGRGEADRAWAAVSHAAELQLPEAWLPFVVSR